LKKPTTGKLVAGIIFALIAGVLDIFLLPFSMFALALPVLISALYAWAGIIPAAVASITAAGVMAFTFGPFMLWAVPLALVAPAVIVIYLLERGEPFFKRLRIGLFAQFLAVALTLGFAYMILKVDLADALINYLQGMFVDQPHELLDMFLDGMAAMGLSEFAIEGERSAAQRAEQLNWLLDRLLVSLKYALPSVIISSCAFTAMLTTHWSALIRAKRGDERSEGFMPLSEWRVPNNVVLGAAGCLAFSIILAVMGVAGAESLVNVVLTVFYMILAVQGFSGVLRRMKARGIARRARNLFIILVLLFGDTRVFQILDTKSILRLIGIYITLFGSGGAIRIYIKKHEKHGRDEGR